MIKNYLINSYRSTKKNKLNFLISVVGISVGLASCILIFMYVNHEFNYDLFHSNSDNIYRMKEEFPEVLDYCRFRPFYRGMSKEANIHFDNETYRLNKVFFADSSIFSIFSFPLVSGSVKNQLNKVNTALISEELAYKYFNNENPIGKIIAIDQFNGIEITGIFKNIPENSHIKFDVLISFLTIESRAHHFEDDKWIRAQVYTYILCHPGVYYKKLEEKLPAFINKNKPELNKNREREEFFLQPFKNIHLHSKLLFETEKNQDISTIWFLIILAVLIMIIAWVNYINLSASTAIERAKEISIKKIIGCKKIQLVGQFITEGFIINTLSSILSFIIIIIASHWLSSFFWFVYSP